MEHRSPVIWTETETKTKTREVMRMKRRKRMGVVAVLSMRNESGGAWDT